MTEAIAAGGEAYHWGTIETKPSNLFLSAKSSFLYILTFYVHR